MEGAVFSPTIKPINKSVVHRICSGQVIFDLSSAVKELVENSLDAGATSIEISLKEYGQDSFKITDNGCGISPNNFQVLALKHHTSKIADFADLQSLTTFGFRGEALSSLCALGNLTIETRTKNEQIGTHLTFDHSGLMISERKTARQVGTTVTVEKLFFTLPVRSKEFSRNIRREYGKLISLLNAYAVMAKGVRVVCTNTTGKNVKSVVIKTQGSGSVKDNILTVFGMNTLTSLENLSISISDSYRIEGFISKPGNGSGRNLGDRQFFYVNGRPVDMPKVSKLLNELYRSANSRQYPIAIMNFIVPTKAYDVNVAPDKRKVFFSDEGSYMLSLREAIENIYSSGQCSYSVNQFEGSIKAERDDPTGNSPHEEEEPHVSSDMMSPNEKKDQDYVLHSSMPEGLVRNKEDPLSESKDVVVTPSVNSSGKSKVFNDYQPRQLRTPSLSNSCNHSNFVQSSLTKYITLNKRKHESSSAGFSELPVLRNEMVPCQVRKINKDNNAVPMKSLVEHHGDDFTDKEENELLEHHGEENELLEHHGAVHVSSEVETSLSAEADTYDNGFGEKRSLPHAEFGRSTCDNIQNLLNDISSQPALSQSCTTTTLDSPMPDLHSEKCYVLHFSINDLSTRRQERWSRSCTSNSSNEIRKIKRAYAAATLENSQPENEEAKARALTAATTELERFFRKEDFGRMKVIGQFNLGFIIGKVDKDLFIVDQHAADEKYNFEKLSQSTILNQQPLLQPMRLELSPEEEVVASVHMDIIRKNGFTLAEDASAPSGHRFLLKAVPFSKNITFGAEDVKELISTLTDSQGECSIMRSYKMDDPNSLCPSRVWGMLASRACRSSVMIGDPLGRNEMQKILKHLVGLKSPWNCPHGRPTMRHLLDLTTLRNK